MSKHPDHCHSNNHLGGGGTIHDAVYKGVPVVVKKISPSDICYDPRAFYHEVCTTFVESHTRTHTYSRTHTHIFYTQDSCPYSFPMNVILKLLAIFFINCFSIVFGLSNSSQFQSTIMSLCSHENLLPCLAAGEKGEEMMMILPRFGVFLLHYAFSLLQFFVASLPAELSLSLSLETTSLETTSPSRNDLSLSLSKQLLSLDSTSLS